jgi:hypothetical protein
MKRQTRRGFIAALAVGAFFSLGGSVLGGAATTDAGGHFVILSLAPDTYTIYLYLNAQVRI